VPPLAAVPALARAGKADLGRVGTGIQGHLQLAGRGHVNAVDQGRHQPDHGRHRVGLHRVMQLHLGRQGRAQLRNPGTQQATVVGIKRRLADALGQQRQLLPADDQFAARIDRELGHRHMDRRHALGDEGGGV